jgi:proliferating cell nuclear antigen
VIPTGCACVPACLPSPLTAACFHQAVTIDLEEPVSQSFAMGYLAQFCKATPLSSTVTLKLHEESPLVVEYPVGDMGYIRYFLAPKIDEEDE